ncbi:hypothetical protein [Pseudoalteromonas sp. MTN2-4]|uniref:hypothetical protein n=1 Tax=Pseudoalteromonas sp. MTN2-4 TaxID=3056555 RepID=UPI0036F39DFB
MIQKEIALVSYLAMKGEIPFKDFINWVGEHYNESTIFQTIMHESTCVSDGVAVLLENYDILEFPEAFWLSKIAEDFISNKISLLDSVKRAYELLNLKGSGNHELSGLLYQLVDDFNDESKSQLVQRIKASNFESKLQAYNLGQWTELTMQVFNKKI